MYYIPFIHNKLLLLLHIIIVGTHSIENNIIFFQTLFSGTRFEVSNVITTGGLTVVILKEIKGGLSYGVQQAPPAPSTSSAGESKANMVSFFSSSSLVFFFYSSPCPFFCCCLSHFLFFFFFFFFFFEC